MKNYFTIYAVLIIVSLYAASPAQTTDVGIKRELIGVWQNSKGVGSGLTDNYQFLSDGRFQFNYNQMDGTKRLLSFSGFWNVQRGMLYLHANRVALLIGGKWVKASGSIATEYEIEGGRVTKKRISPVEKSVLDISAFQLEDETYTTVKIGGEKFWKLSSDPGAFEN
ncbi:MAG: hypothetical protein OEM82_02140 [Acidobacteriota bacterium]|nr:hypothetical protein [Acidobacteriota bacterium]MDH3530815.1 hypothetical protein [Acidobacteriota bacterium]